MKKIFLLFLVIITAISFVGCSKKAEKKDNKIKKIKVAEVTHSMFYAPLYVSDALGYFKENNLDVDIILTSGANNVAAAVISGDVQIGLCGSEQTIYIYNEGAEDYLVNFAGLTKRDGSFLVAREKNDNFKMSDLNNAWIIGGRTGGMPAMTLSYTINEHNVKNANVDTSIDFAAMSGAFIAGNGDYVTLFEPNALKLEQEGYGYVVASLGKLGGEVPYTVFNAKKSYIKNNPEVIEGFSKAIQMGLDYVHTHSAEDVAKIITPYFADNTLNEVTEVVKRYMENDSWYQTTYITEEGFNHIKEIIDFNGLLEKDAPYNDLVNNTYNHE
jgi:NitT/TauT family transport system substrate-binding protein